MFSELLAKIAKDLEPKVVKTITMKPAWKKQFAEVDKAAKETAAADDRMCKLRDEFWATVEKEAKLKGKALRYNEKKGVIEVLELPSKTAKKRR